MVLNVVFSFFSMLCCILFGGMAAHATVNSESIMEAGPHILVVVFFTGLFVFLVLDAFYQIRKYLKEGNTCDS